MTVKLTKKPKVHGAESRKAFLDALTEGATHKSAAEAVGVSYVAVWKWRQKDPAFDAAVAEAEAAGTAALADECRRRGVEGVDEPIFYKGELCGTVRRYSDTLLMFLMKSRDPVRYCDRARTAVLMQQLEARKQNKDVGAAPVLDRGDAALCGLQPSTSKPN